VFCCRQLVAVFNLYDSDGSGFIDRHEFELLLADLGELCSSNEITQALKVIDTSNDGLISLSGTSGIVLPL
jgi:Ca2+-binding EF-hand superfamily protein